MKKIKAAATINKNTIRKPELKMKEEEERRR